METTTRPRITDAPWYWTTPDRSRTGERRGLYLDADAVAWITPSTVDPWRPATPSEVARAVPMAHGHWGPPAPLVGCATAPAPGMAPCPDCGHLAHLDGRDERGAMWATCDWCGHSNTVTA